MGNHSERVLDYKGWTCTGLAGILPLYTSMWEPVYHSTSNTWRIENNSKSMIPLSYSSFLLPFCTWFTPGIWGLFNKKAESTRKGQITVILDIQMHSIPKFLDWSLQIPLFLQTPFSSFLLFCWSEMIQPGTEWNPCLVSANTLYPHSFVGLSFMPLVSQLVFTPAVLLYPAELLSQ